MNVCRKAFGIAMLLLLTAVLTAETRTIIDQNGRKVEIPEKINKVVMTAFPLPAVYYALTGSCDKIVGIHPGCKGTLRDSMLGMMAPELMNAATGFVRGKDLNIEELLKLKPDIVIFWGLYPKQVEQFDAIGIPAIAVHTIKNGNALETLQSWLNLLGQIFGKEEKAPGLIAYSYETIGMIYSRLWEVSQKKKPRALILFYHSAEGISVTGTGYYSQFWLQSTGAVNVAESISGRVGVNMEQIYKWNPDIVYISNFSNTMPEDILNNTIEGQDWSKIKAVKDGRVYKIPLGIYKWVPPSTDVPLMLKWLAQKHHPKLFGDYTMEKELKTYYSRFYNYKLSEKQVERILYPVRRVIVSGEQIR